jgi:hypothetical protein
MLHLRSCEGSSRERREWWLLGGEQWLLTATACAADLYVPLSAGFLQWCGQVGGPLAGNQVTRPCSDERDHCPYKREPINSLALPFHEKRPCIYEPASHLHWISHALVFRTLSNNLFSRITFILNYVSVLLYGYLHMRVVPEEASCDLPNWSARN